MSKQFVPVLKREAGVDRAKASNEVVLERLDGTLSGIAAVVACRYQLIGDVMRGNLRPHESGDFIVKTLEAGAKASALKERNGRPVGFDEMFFGARRNGSGRNIVTIIIIEDKYIFISAD